MQKRRLVMEWRGVEKMSLYSTNFYAEQFKVNIMENMLGEKTVTLNDFLFQLINEHQNDYKEILYAYIKVKRELLGDIVEIIILPTSTDI